MRGDLDEILDAIDMEAFFDMEGIDYRITHGRSGTQLNVRECPACGNANWKVYINAESGLGNCFSGDCGETFNKWKFIYHFIDADNGKDVADYARAVAREMGWRAPRRTSAAVEERPTSPTLPESYPIPIKGKNLRYLEERGVTSEMARYFHLRYCHKGYFNYTVGGERRRQDYSRRIIIPVFDLDGALVSFQGRDITGEAERKYLFPPGYASTGRYLYNGHNARGAKRLVINEGAFDVIATKMAFDEDVDLRDVAVVGSFGKHLSEGSGDGLDQIHQLLLLKREGLKEVTIMWDGEAKALSDAAETALNLVKFGFAARVAVLPKDRDPNEVPRSVVREAFWNALPATKSNMARLKISCSL